MLFLCKFITGNFVGFLVQQKGKGGRFHEPFVLGTVIMMLAVCSPVLASESAGTVEWGTKAAITGVAKSFITDPVITNPANKNVLLENASLVTLGNALLTPDGASIIYTDMTNGSGRFPWEVEHPKSCSTVFTCIRTTISISR